MIWSMPVHCEGVEDQAAIKETVGSLNRVGYLELIVRSDNEPAMSAFLDTVIRELKERFGVRAIAQAPPKYDFASAGMVENAIKQGQGESVNPDDCDSSQWTLSMWRWHGVCVLLLRSFPIL